MTKIRLEPAPTVERAQLLMPSGAIAETFSRLGAATSSGLALNTSGQMTMVALPLRARVPINSISFLSGTQAAVAPTHQWFALFDSARALLRQTTNDTTTAWAANTSKTLSLTSQFTTTYEGLHYLGINVTAGTVPSLINALTGAIAAALAPIIAGVSTTGLTGTAPNPAGAITGWSNTPYAYVS